MSLINEKQLKKIADFTRGTKTVLNDTGIPTSGYTTDVFYLEDTVYIGEIDATDGRLSITANLINNSTNEIDKKVKLNINSSGSSNAHKYLFYFDTKGYRLVSFDITHESGSQQIINSFDLAIAGSAHLYKNINESKKDVQEIKQSMSKKFLSTEIENVDPSFEGLLPVLGVQLYRIIDNLNNSLIAVDSQENLYTGVVTSNFVRKIDSMGNIHWEFSEGTQLVSLFVTESHVFMGHRTGIRCLDTNGIEQWYFPINDWARKLNYKGGNVYFSCRNGEVGKVEVSSGDGEIIGTYNNGADSRGISIDSSGDIYVSGDGRTTKIDSGGNVIWESNFSNNARDNRIGRNGGLFVASTNGIRKLNTSTGSIEEHVSTPGSAVYIAVDYDNTLYVADSSGYIYKFTENLAEVWRVQFNEDCDNVQLSPNLILYGNIRDKIYKMSSELQIKGFRLQ